MRGSGCKSPGLLGDGRWSHCSGSGGDGGRRSRLQIGLGQFVVEIKGEERFVARAEGPLRQQLQPPRSGHVERAALRSEKQVDILTKPKVSGGTVSENGRSARDVLLGLAKTCAKLKISFFHYLGARLKIPQLKIPWLPDLINLAPS